MKDEKKAYEDAISEHVTRHYQFPTVDPMNMAEDEVKFGKDVKDIQSILRNF